MRKKYSFIVSVSPALAVLFLGCVLFFPPLVVFAKTDLSISETDITFSKNDILEGNNVRIYARVFNIGESDVFGFVSFLAGAKEIGSPQPISLRPNTYDDVFVDWQPVAGKYDITAKIIGQNLSDDNLGNNATIKKGIVVSADKNKNGIADSIDSAILSRENNSVEIQNNASAIKQTNDTNVVTADANGDGTISLYESVQQNLDSFAASNPIKSGIASLNEAINSQAGKLYHLAIGDNSSTDSQNNALDINPLLFGASLLDSIVKLLGGNKVIAYLAIGISTFLVLYFLFFRRKRRRRR